MTRLLVFSFFFTLYRHPFTAHVPPLFLSPLLSTKTSGRASLSHLYAFFSRVTSTSDHHQPTDQPTHSVNPRCTLSGLPPAQRLLLCSLLRTHPICLLDAHSLPPLLSSQSFTTIHRRASEKCRRVANINLFIPVASLLFSTPLYLPLPPPACTPHSVPAIQ